MELSSALLKSFAQVTNDEPEESSAGTAYGTLYVQSDGNYVLLDGGTSLTPVVMATDSRDGDRVVVTIENHVATVTSNITTPSSGYVAIETEASLIDEINYTFELAYDEATNAAIIANGKTRAYYQTSAPSGSSFTTNDIWFDTDDGYKMYFWNGSAWTAARFGSSALGDGSVVASTIASEAITTGKIAAGAVTAVKIDVNDLFAQNITATGTITGVTLKAATGEFTGDVIATSIKANRAYSIYVQNVDNYITVISASAACDTIYVGYGADNQSVTTGFDISVSGGDSDIAVICNEFTCGGNGTFAYDLSAGGNLYAEDGNRVYIQRIYNTSNPNISVSVSTYGHFIPWGGESETSIAGTVNCGTSNNYWHNVNYDGALNNQSDKRYKNDLGLLPQDFAVTLLENLTLRKFTFKSDKLGAVRYGIFAQDLRDLLISENVGHIAALSIGVNETDNDTTNLLYPEDDVTYFVDYTQFVPVLMSGWQYHNEEIEDLKVRVEFLERELYG